MARNELISHTIPCNASRITPPRDATLFPQTPYPVSWECDIFSSMDAGIKGPGTSGALASQNDIQS